jgi:hypothetical protein
MLTAHRKTPTRRILCLGVAALALTSMSCGSVISGEHSQSFNFLVEPHSDGTFSGWTNIHVAGNINSVGTTVLYGVTLSVQSPPEADLSFLSTLTGEAMGTTVATLNSFPPGQQTANMTIVYLGDLHPLFEDSSTIHIVWTGSTNPAFTAWPQGGIWVQGNVVINVE